MEECASDYVRQIQQHQHSGPYLIGGYCFGGFIAFEMARQLHHAGHALPLLVIFDTSTERTPALDQNDERISQEKHDVVARVWDQYHKMIQEYQPKAYSGRVLLIQSTDLMADISDRPALKHLLDMCSEGYELHRVKDGDCFVFEDPCVNHLGNILASKISRSAPSWVP